MPKKHLPALKQAAKSKLRIRDLRHTLEWVFLSLSGFSETVDEEKRVFVCDVCMGTAHSAITKPQSALKW